MDLDAVFRARSVAVIGASAKRGSIGYVIVKNLKDRFRGKVYPVNPKYKEILGLKCYPRIGDVDGEVDVAVIAVPAKTVIPVVSECGRKGVKVAIVISGGFREIGGEGVRLEEMLVEEARKHGIRIIGPNCMGIYDTNTGLDTFFLPTIRCGRPKNGHISFISQSGAFAAAVMDQLTFLGLGMSRCISYGNASDIDETDLIAFLREDDKTRVITMYIETAKGGRKFIEEAYRTTRVKPIIAIKAGRTSRGVSAVLSHTGSMAGSDRIFNSAFKQAGVIRATNFQEMFDMAKALSSQPTPKGNRILVITDGGGAGVMTVDACEMSGLKVPELPDDVKHELKRHFPPYASVHNPIDLTGSVTDDWYGIALEVAGSIDLIDGIIVNVLFQPPRLTLKLADVVADYAREADKPVVCCLWGGRVAESMAKDLESQGVPTYPTPERAVKAMWALYTYGRIRER